MSTEEAFKPYVIKSDNISKELKTASKSSKVPVGMVDFDLLSYKTYIKTNEHQSDSEWTEVDNEILKKFKDEKFLILSDLEIKQIYEVRIRPSKPDKHNLSMTLTGNKILTKASIILKDGSEFEYSDDLFSELLEYFNKRKLKLGLMIGIFDEHLRDDIKDVVKEIKENGSLSQEFKIRLCECVDPIDPIDDKIVYHYKEKHKHDEQDGANDKVDYSDRNFLYAVTRGEMIMEYIKPQSGRGGRGCKGNYIDVEEPKNDHEQEANFNITQKLERVDNEKNVVYLSKDNGYIDFHDNTYDISDKLEVAEVSFKSTGSINAGKDSDIKINVKETDSFKDAIGSGVKVEVSEANIEGSMGSGSEVTCKFIRVGGQTHKTSKIFTDRGEINVHKGYAKASKDIKIARLENGVVEADTVRVSEAIGGEIRAKEVYIDTLKSNVLISASKLIHIKNVIGEDNRCIIDPLSLSASANFITKMKDRIDQLEKDIKTFGVTLIKKTKDIQTMQRVAEIVRGKITQAKSENRKPDISDVMKLKQYQSLVQEFKGTREKLTKAEAEVEKLKKDLTKIQESIFDAKIINDNIWTFNTVIFHIIDPEQKIEYSPEASDKEIKLIRNSETGAYQVVGID